MSEYKSAADVILKSKYTIAFTGAGVSAESGIPTFRDKGGLWEKFPVELFGTPRGIIYVLLNEPQRFAEFIRGTAEVLVKSKPNPGHIALAELEKLGFLKVVITQNIDNLHQEGGSSHVIEVHGSVTRLRCILCDRRKSFQKDWIIDRTLKLADRLSRVDFSQFIQGERINIGMVIEKLSDVLPICDCGGIMRPDVVLFTEPVQDINIAFEYAKQADCCIIAGTSGVVYPAAYIPQIVKSKNGFLIEINPTASAFNSDIYIRETFASAMPRIVEEIKSRIN